LFKSHKKPAYENKRVFCGYGNRKIQTLDIGYIVSYTPIGKLKIKGIRPN